MKNAPTASYSAKIWYNENENLNLKGKNSNVYQIAFIKWRVHMTFRLWMKEVCAIVTVKLSL